MEPSRLPSARLGHPQQAFPPMQHLPCPGRFHTTTCPAQGLPSPRPASRPQRQCPSLPFHRMAHSQQPRRNLPHQHEAFLQPKRPRPKEFPSLGGLLQALPSPGNGTHPIQDFPSQGFCFPGISFLGNIAHFLAQWLPTPKKSSHAVAPKCPQRAPGSYWEGNELCHGELAAQGPALWPRCL